MELDQIKDLMAIVEKSSKIKRLLIKRGDFELQIEKEEDHPHFEVPSGARAVSEHPMSAHLEHGLKGGKPVRAPEAVVEGKFITSPMVGTFYGSPGPDQPPFVKVGDRVAEDTVVCIVEAMKVMNEVKANVNGTIAEILIDSAHPVEFGSKMFRVT